MVVDDLWVARRAFVAVVETAVRRWAGPDAVPGPAHPAGRPDQAGCFTQVPTT